MITWPQTVRWPRSRSTRALAARRAIPSACSPRPMVFRSRIDMTSKKIQLADVLNLFEYEKVRDDRRRRVMELKRVRRVSVGHYLVFVFENRDTLLFQIQEMCRVERIIADAKIQDEIDVYGPLLPGAGILSATMMIEIDDTQQIKSILERFMGIDVGRHVAIEVGHQFTIPGEFETGHSDAEKGQLSAVHFVRFQFPDAAIRALPDAEAFLVVDHPAEQSRTRLSEEAKAALLEDLKS
ncbi:MAG: DUF3501 domain-containing protein [Candidatus Rokuibacteriota bacterium]|nr:MAG: DUF3501 domain-containing protein [Candidatus Rokubacteria bacterium]